MSSKDTITEAVSLIKTAILQSQARAAAAVNQEQLSLYYGIGRYVSQNTRNKNWGTGAIKSISDKLKAEIPGIRGFGETNLKNMRLFYESWKELDTNHISKSAGLLSNSSVATDDISQIYENEGITIRQSQLTKLPNFPLAEFLSISFTHHVSIFTYAKDFDERIFYIRYAHENKPSAECLEKAIRKQDLYHHQGKIANNFLSTMPDYKQAFQAIQMFKDEYLLDFINVEELGVRDEDSKEELQKLLQSNDKF